MFENKKIKSLICTFLTFLMVFASVDTGVLGMKQVFAKTVKEESEVVETKNLSSEKGDKALVDEKQIKDIVNKIQSNNAEILSIKIVNNFSKVKVEDEIELEVRDEKNQAIPVENLTFKVSNKELGRMDEKVSNKFIAIGSGTIAIEVALKDKLNLKDKVEFKIEKNLETIVDVKQKGLVDETLGKPNVKTTLKDMTTKADKLTFDLWAKDANGNKIKGSDVKVTNNEKPVSVTWDDKEKTSYTLNLEVGTNNVEINIIYNEKNYTQKYTLIREQAEDGEEIGTFTFSMEAFTIGLGYLIEPVQVDIHKGRNAAQELDAILKEYGYKYRNTGTLESGFYLSTLLNGTNKVYKTTPKIPEVLKKKLDENYDEKKYNSKYGLGEFDFNNLSGWMYAVNSVFPNVGFSDKYLQDGDVMRVQFTLAYGNDIGGSDAMGGGSGAEFFPKVNKDELTKKIAQINSSVKKDEYLSNSKIKRAYDNGIEILQKFGISQQEIDKASKNLAQAVEEVNDMTGTLPKPEQPGKPEQPTKPEQPGKPEKPQKPEQPEKFVAKRIGKGNLKKDSSVEVEFNIENKSGKDDEVTLAIVLYDKKTNEMINYSCVKKTLKVGEKESFAGGFTIPAKGDYVVKFIICDNLDKEEGKMNILVDPVEIAVE